MDGSAARAVLGLAPGTSRADIDIAFRRLAKATHPDHGGSAAAFRELVVARRTALETAVTAPPQRLPFLDATTLDAAPSWDFTRLGAPAPPSFAAHLRHAMRT